MRIPVPVPKHLWEKVTSAVSSHPAVLVWRVFLVVGFIILIGAVLAATGGGGVIGIFVLFVLTSIISYVLRDDILAIWRDLWNANWGEVEV